MDNQNPPLDPSHEFPKPQLDLPAPKPHKSFLLIGIIVLVLLLAGLGYILAAKKNSTPVANVQPTVIPATKFPTLTIDITASWKVYSFDTFSLKLPEDWHQEKNQLSPLQFTNYKVPTTGGSFNPIKDKGRLKIEIYTHESDTSPDLKSFVNKQVMNPGMFDDSKSPQKDVMVGGQTGVLIESAAPGFYVYLQNPTTKKYMSITFGLDFDNYTPLAEDILKTFQFKSQTTISDFYSCTSDSDCITVDAGTCGCNEGGKATAINKSSQTSWDQKLSEDRRGMMCPQVISQDPSCNATPKCIQNKCTLLPQ